MQERVAFWRECDTPPCLLMQSTAPKARGSVEPWHKPTPRSYAEDDEQCTHDGEEQPENADERFQRPWPVDADEAAPGDRRAKQQMKHDPALAVRAEFRKPGCAGRRHDRVSDRSLSRPGGTGPGAACRGRRRSGTAAARTPPRRARCDALPRCAADASRRSPPRSLPPPRTKRTPTDRGLRSSWHAIESRSPARPRAFVLSPGRSRRRWSQKPNGDTAAHAHETTGECRANGASVR